MKKSKIDEVDEIEKRLEAEIKKAGKTKKKKAKPKSAKKTKNPKKARGKKPKKVKLAKLKAVKKPKVKVSAKKTLSKKENKTSHVLKSKTVDKLKQKVSLGKASKVNLPIKGKVLDHYKLKIDNAEVEIKIEKGEKGLEYNLYLPEIKPATQALLDEVRKDLISLTTMGAGEIVDEKSVNRIKKVFMADTSKILREKLPKIEPDVEQYLTSMLMQEMLGLGKIEFLINDIELEEIVIIGSKEPVRVYHKKFGWLSSNIELQHEDQINNYANIIARRVGRQVTILSPLLDAHVVTGDRANAVLYPISTKGNTITIRKFARDPWTVVDLIKNKTVNLDVAVLLWLGIEYEMNIIISGGTASGKTVFLNAFLPFVPPNQRIISIEDTRELTLPEFLYWCPLVTRTANPEGKGEVSMLDLLINSLRMRPDRIILGEMRRQREAEVMFEAMHTGHSVYATLHADTCSETINRLTNPPLNVPENLLKAVNLNVVMFRDRRKGVRRAFQIGEFLVGKDARANILYRWVPERDEIIPHNPSMKFFEDLARNTGMTREQMNANMEKKKTILNWLMKNNIRNLKNIGKVMNLYYTNKEMLFDIIKKNKTYLFK